MPSDMDHKKSHMADKRLIAVTALLGVTLLFFFLQQPSSPKCTQPPAHSIPATHTPVTKGFVYDAPAYSHMVRRPEDVFPMPASGAWVFFVGINEDKNHYLHWALTSIQCMQNTNTRWDIVVFFEGTDKSAADYLRKAGVRVILLDEYVRTVPVDLTDFHRRNQESDAKGGGWYHAWNKLLAWTLTEYEKLVLIDSDAILWNNADELFMFPEFAAVQDSVWPLMSQDYTQYFNTGVMVIKPSVETFNSLMKTLDGWARPTSFWWDLSEQTYLNMYFNTSWYHLPLSYNYVSFLFAGALAAEWNVEGIKVVHHLRDSQFDLPFSTPDCIKHYCPRCVRACVNSFGDGGDHVSHRCCEKLMVCKSQVLEKVGIVQQRAQRKYANEHTDEENARYINKQMERLGLI